MSTFLQNGTCYIVLAGVYAYSAVTLFQHDYVIAADGGYDHARRMSLRVDELIGDMDSIADVPDGVAVTRYSTDKDFTDAHLAAERAMTLGYRRIVFLCGEGGRLSHAMGVLLTMRYIAERGGYPALYGERMRAYVTVDRIAVERGDYTYLSVIPLSSTAKGVCITGTAYALDQYDMTQSHNLGVSNRITSDVAQISVADGVLLIITD